MRSRAVAGVKGFAMSCVLALAACHSAPEQDVQAAVRAVTTCADKAQEVALPADFPLTFPLPARTIVIGSQKASQGGVLIIAISADPEPDVLAFLQSELPRVGYTLSGMDVGKTVAVATWSAPSRGLGGLWAIGKISGCDADTALAVRSAPVAA